MSDAPRGTPGGEMKGGARVLIVSDDDDVAAPLRTLLARSGHSAEVAGGAEAPRALSGAPPDLLVLDRDLPQAAYQAVIAILEERHGGGPFPLLVVGGGTAPRLPGGWPEDAALSIGRPPAPGEVIVAVYALLRLAFYRPYRTLVHDLSQPVTTLHALGRLVARHPPADPEARETIERLLREADRLMDRMEAFQHSKARIPGG